MKENIEDFNKDLFKEFIFNKNLYEDSFYFCQSHLNLSNVLEELDEYCPKCKKEKTFKNDIIKGTNFPSDNINLYENTDIEYGFVELKYLCVSCNFNRLYYLNYSINDNLLKIKKIGQYPKKRLNINKSLKKFFNNDYIEYKKAVECIDSSLGVAGFTYLRRILEKNIKKLFNMLKEDMSNNINDEKYEKLIKAISEIDNKSPMSEIIKITDNIIPDYLFINNSNPLKPLYAILSEGIHSLSEEECLNISEEVLLSLEYLISELYNRKDKQKIYKESLYKIQNKNRDLKKK